MQQDFIPGQRWLSDSEADLGLGTVLRIDGRLVHIGFPGAGEERIYARQSAPVTRVRFTAGDRVEDQDGRALTVMDVGEHAGLLRYRVSDDRGDVQDLPEAALNDRLRLNRPQDKLFSGRLDADLWMRLRHETWLRSAESARSPVLGLRGPRIGLIPHQLYIAAEVAGRHAPRVLLADEVGLGKTIEAGLILHRLLLSGRASRVLILVPEPLLHQWLVEMRRRFNLAFSLFDAERLESMGEAAAETNPFHGEQRILCALDLLTTRPEVARAALDGEWDLLVVDEAHHLHWSEQGSSLEYDLVEALAACTPALLLLTATPEQLGRAGHFARLRLLDPRRFHDYGAFLAEERDYGPVAGLAARLLDRQPLEPEQEALLRDLLGADAEGGPDDLIRRLVDRHGTGRVLFRNTRAAIKGFPGRRLLEHPLPRPEGYPRTGADIPDLLTPEAAAGEDWTAIDPRVPWLIRTLRELRPEKVLVICAHSRTARELREALRTGAGIQAALFHEGLEIIERDRAAAYFADPEEGAQVLICSEIGSEGRNFQFAHHLVLLDLPLEPDLLEQRIGRLDRIGQGDTVRIHVPYLRGSAGETLLRWYRDGLGAFEAVCPAAGAVYERLADGLRDALRTGDGVDALIAEAADLTRRINRELEAGRDRLLEINSHRPQEAERLAGLIRDADEDVGLQSYMESYWDAFGVEHEPGPGRSIVLHAGRHMRHQHFPGLPQDGVTLTLERADALAHEDREFLTWEHPMVRGAMEMLASDDLGSAAVTLVRHPGFKPGSYFLELLYLAECTAPAGLETARFLPPTCVRLVLDADGRDRSGELLPGDLRGQCLAHNRKLAEKLLRTLAERLRSLFAAGADQAAGQARTLVDGALESMERELGEELRRLEDLARVNPNVRPDELEHLAARRDQLGAHLRNTRVRLDAARVVVMQ